MITTQPRAYTLKDHDIILGESEQRYVLRVKDLPDTEKPREKLLVGTIALPSRPITFGCFAAKC